MSVWLSQRVAREHQGEEAVEEDEVVQAAEVAEGRRLKEPSCLFTTCPRRLPQMTSMKPLVSTAQSLTLTTLADDWPSSHLQALRRRTQPSRRWRGRRCAAGPSSATLPSPGRQPVAAAAVVVVDVEVDVVVVAGEVPGEAAGEEEGACPYLWVEALGQIRRCPLTELLLSDGRKFISHFTIAICIP